MKEKTIYALGFFDGVHKGHQALLSACKELATAEKCRTGVVTFTNHPDALVFGENPRLITTAADRRALLKHYGMETIVEIPFDKEMMQTPWQSFLAMLEKDYGGAGFVCGHDFRFGKGGEGTAPLLQAFCQEKGMVCRVVAEQKIGDITVSSTYIRSLIEAGDMEKTAQFLGHSLQLTGEIVKGKQLGRTFGIPTANMALPKEMVALKHGVYAGLLRVDGETHLAVTNIGSRPTVGGQNVTVESWLPDFSGDLYGKTATVTLSYFLREEKKFQNVEALRAEIQKNAAEARKLLGK